MTSLVIGVDASRSRSGGAVAHLKGLMSAADPRAFGIGTVHLWAYDELRSAVPEQPWLVKHEVPTGPIGRQLWWQYATLPWLLDQLKCDLVFNTDAGSVCPAQNAATLSQDMLSFEPGEMQRYGLSKARLRLEVLKRIQGRSLKRGRLAIFLTEHARTTIQSQIGPVVRSVVIPHGIDDMFRSAGLERRPFPKDGPIRCLYVSNAAPYKHQWHVVEAVASLRKQGVPLELSLVGGGSGRAQAQLEQALAQHDPERGFVTQTRFVPNGDIPGHLARADIFIFASSCENLPVTMLEAMASGVPICSSDRGPMPEVLGQAGVYFDPESPTAIARALRVMVRDDGVRDAAAAAALQRSRAFTWERCASETWRALADLCRA